MPVAQGCRGLALAILALALLACMSAGASCAPVALTGDAERVPVAGHLSVLRDESGTMTLEQVEQAAQAGRFRAIEGDFNPGYSRHGAWWLCFTVEARAGGAGLWWLELAAPFTDLIDVYLPEAGPEGAPQMAHRRTGGLLPLASRDLRANTFTVKARFAAGVPQTIWLRLAGERSISLRPVLWRYSALVDHLVVGTMLRAAVIGASLLMAIGALLFGAWLREATFVWYGLYAGAMALVFFANNGFAALAFEAVPPPVLLRLQTMNACFSIMTGAFLSLSIFGGHTRRAWVRWYMRALGLAGGAGIVLSAFGLYGLIAPSISLGVVGLACIVPLLAIGGVIQHRPAAVWYCIGFSLYTPMIVLFMARLLGFVPLSPASEWGYQALAVAHMGALLAGLATALRAGVRERRTLQGRLLAATRANERALEQAVVQRTAALEAEIAARREAEDALKGALREQHQFLVMVGHEFRTPLGTILTAGATIANIAAARDPDIHREAGRIERAVQRLIALIDTFLAEAWLEKAAMQIRRQPVDLAAMVGELCRDWGRDTGRTLQWDARHPAPVVGDPILLRTALDNLVSNAIKYSDPPSVIRLAVASQAAGVTVSVTDQGLGIPLAEQRLVFDRFYRAGIVASRPGIGIGLHMVRRIVELHGGTVEVSSTPGLGSTFTVRLPADRPCPPDAQEEEAGACPSVS